MIPDWLQDVSRLGGSTVSDGLERGAESYLRTLAAAEDADAPDAAGHAAYARNS